MMSPGIESVAAVAAQQSMFLEPATLGAESAQHVSAPSAFANVLQQQFSDLNASMSAAETAISDVAAGKPVELHEVMISLERARLSVQTFVQVRNKVVEAYQDLMRMQL